MKKKILLILFIVFCVWPLLWATWEGNGGIGAASDFPANGLFVKSDMFPKHTLLEITNLEKSVTARAVVVGSSGVPGLLAVLSPDLGNKLSVPAGKVVRIRVLTPSPVQEIGDDGASVDVAEAASAAFQQPPKKEEPVQEQPKRVTAGEASFGTQRPVAEKMRTVSQQQETERPIKQVPPVVKTVVFMEPASERPPITVPGIVKPKKAESKEDQRAVKQVKEPVQPEPASKPSPEPVKDIPSPREPEKKVIEDEPEVSVINEIKEPEKQLEPEEAEVQAAPDIQEPSKAHSKEEPKKEEVYETAPTQQELEPEEKLVAKAEPEKEVPPPVFNAKLEKGKLYVQIAMYTDKKASDSVVAQYGTQYPLLIKESKSGNKDRYTIFVGPLQTDETGAIIERFKTLGFKGAFLKRGK